MNINRINTVSFKGKIIDAHVHVGHWKGANYTNNEIDVFTKSPLQNGDTIEKIIVSNLSCIEPTNMKDELVGNKELLDLSRSSSKIAPLAVCQPKTGSVSNIERLFNENPNMFVGLKFHPDEHQIMASDTRFIPYLEFAKKHNLPCLFHCGVNWENGKLVDESKQFSSPERIYLTAKKMPDVPVIMAHLGAGGGKVHTRAVSVLMESLLKNDAKLYADISWVDIDNPQKPTIINLIKRLRNSENGDFIGRLLFGSDAPIGEFASGKDGLSGKEFYEKTVADIKAAIKKNFSNDADEIINRIFYQNANELFFTQKADSNFVTTETAAKKTKYGKYVVGLTLLVVGVLSFLFAKEHRERKSLSK